MDHFFSFCEKLLLNQPLETDKNFWLGIFFIPLGWIIIFGLVGSYNSIYKKSRLTEFTSTFICTLIGCTALFFLFLLDDVKNNYNYYYSAFAILFGLHVLLIWIGRLVILSMAKTQITNKTIRF
jgi:FlaA1/EpsC-like NDP-sugar epimerase